MRALCALCIGFALMMMLGPLVLGHEHPPQDEELHVKFYLSWMIPPLRNVSCCDKRDCYPTAVKNVGGTWFVERREDREWIPVPEHKIEQNQKDPKESPDGRAHVCLGPPPYGVLHCFTHGSGV